MTICRSTLGIASEPRVPTTADLASVTGHGWHRRVVPFLLGVHRPTATINAEHGLPGGKGIGLLHLLCGDEVGER